MPDLILLLFKLVPGRIILMESLHNHYHRGTDLMNLPGGQGVLHPPVCILKLNRADSLLRINRVIDQNDMSVEARQRSSYRSAKPASSYLCAGRPTGPFLKLFKNFVI